MLAKHCGKLSFELATGNVATPPTVSVIIPHFSDLGGLDQCLAALGRQTYRGAVEVIVADNASPEGIGAVEAVARGRARVVVVREAGAGPARNGGVAASSGAVLAFTDADCLPAPDWLAEGVAALGRADVVGGRMIVTVEAAGRLTPSEAFERVFAFDNRANVTRKGFSVSANLLCARAVFDRVGGFRSPSLPEDQEWCRRACAAGLRLTYAAEAVVRHPARRTWAELTRKWRRLNTQAYHLGLEQPMGGLVWLVKNLALPASAVVHTPKVFLSPALDRLPDRLSALATLYRLRLWRFAHALWLLIASPRPGG